MWLSDGCHVRVNPITEILNDDSQIEEGSLDCESSESDDESDWCVAAHLQAASATIASLKGAIEVTDPAENEKIEKLKESLFEEFGSTSMS